MSAYDVCFVALPFQNPENPALSLSLLHSCLKAVGLRSKVFYANLRFADIIGLDRYCLAANSGSYREALAGEYIFSKAAFEDSALSGYRDFFKGQLREFVPAAQLNAMCDCFEEMRSRVDEFLEETVDEVLRAQPRIVAVSSTTQQNCACIAFCKRLKQRNPQIITVTGGPNCEREMGAELARKIDDFDYVISGEADGFWAEFCRGLLRGVRQFPQYECIFTKEHQQPCAAGFTEVLDEMPLPDFADYFNSLEQYSWKDFIETGLLVESSRGCWWGEKRPCSFCGMNGGSRIFRRKSPERVIYEYNYYYEKYGVRNFFAVDCILAPELIEKALPSLQPLNLNIMYEIKSNTGLPQLRRLADSGVKWVQPGIEALQDDLLRLMNKGNSAVRHIELLKRLSELGMRCCWLLLCDFPDDREEWYREEIELIKRLGHLQPPDAVFKLRYDRFSVYQAEPERYGLELTPVPACQYIFPRELELEKIAYFFRKQEDNTSFYCNDFSRPVCKELLKQVQIWQGRFHSLGAERLEGNVTEDGLEVIDLRDCACQLYTRLTGCAAELLLRADSVVKKQTCVAGLSASYGNGEIETAMERLLKTGWLVEINGELLSLVLLKKSPLPSRDEPPAGHVRLREYRGKDYV